jgi:hypothetical protein
VDILCHGKGQCDKHWQKLSRTSDTRLTRSGVVMGWTITVTEDCKAG